MNSSHLRRCLTRRTKTTRLSPLHIPCLLSQQENSKQEESENLGSRTGINSWAIKQSETQTRARTAHNVPCLGLWFMHSPSIKRRKESMLISRLLYNEMIELAVFRQYIFLASAWRCICVDIATPKQSIADNRWRMQCCLVLHTTLRW